MPAKCGVPDAWINDVRVVVEISTARYRGVCLSRVPLRRFILLWISLFLDEWDDVPVVGAMSGPYDAVMSMQYTGYTLRLDVLTPQSKISGLIQHLFGISSVQNFPIEDSDLPSAIATVNCVHVHPKYKICSSVSIPSNCSGAYSSRALLAHHEVGGP